MGLERLRLTLLTDLSHGLFALKFLPASGFLLEGVVFLAIESFVEVCEQLGVETTH